MGAEQYAHRAGEELPGEEHFLLAALDLPDETALNIFTKMGFSKDEINRAINVQFQEALNTAGVDIAGIASLYDKNSDINIPVKVAYQAAPSGQALMQDLAELRRQDTMIPLLSLHIIKVLCSKRHGVVARSFKIMGIDISDLEANIRDEKNAFKFEA